MSNDILVKVGADITGFSRSMSSASKSLSNFGKSNQQMFKTIGKAGDILTKSITVPAIAATTALTGITLVKGFNRLLGIDTARAKLSALGHDADSVEAIMVNALEAVKGTSFGMDEAATAAASAVAAGIKPGKDLARYLGLAGDAAAIAGTDFNEMGSIFNKVQTAQRAYTGDLNMLADRGIPIYQWLAEEAGTTAESVRDMASKGEVSSKMFLTAIEKNIGGAAKEIGDKSFAAAWKNIGADIGRIGANFLDAGGKAGGFFSTVKPMLSDFRGYLATLEDKATDLGVKFGQAFQRMVDTIKRLKAGYDSLYPAIQKIIKIAAIFGSIFLVMLGPILKFIAFIPSLIKGFAALKAGLAVIGTAIGGISLPVAAVVAALVGLAFVVIKYWKPIKKFFVNLWKTVSKAFVDGFNYIDKATHGWLRNGLAVYKAWFKTGIDLFKRYWQYVKETFSNALAFLKALITLDFGGMKDAIGSQMDSIKSLLGDSWKIIKDRMSKPLKELGKSVRKTFTDIYDWINDKTHGFFGHYIDIWKAQAKTIVGVATAWWSYIKDSFSNALDFLKGLVTLDFKLMGEAIKNQMETSKTFVKDAWKAIKDNIGKKIAEIGRDIKAKLPEWRDAIIDWFKGLPGKIGAQMNVWREKIAGKLEEIKETIAGKVNEWRDSVLDWLKGLPGKITAELENWKTSISTKFTEIDGTISEKITGWGETISKWFNSMPDNILELLEGWKDAIVAWTEEQDEENKRQFGEWAGTISAWFLSIPGEISGWLGEWAAKISGWYDETKEKISGKLESWGETVSKWFVSRPAEIYKQLGEWWAKMSTWFSEIPERIGKKLGEWWQTIKDWFAGLSEKKEIKDAGKNMVDKMSEGNQEKRQEFIDKLGKLIVDVALAALAFAGVALVAAGREIIKRLINGMTSEEGFLRGIARKIGAGVASTFSSVNLFTIGRNIIQGLISGVGSMASSLWNKARSIAAGIASAISGRLEVNSPSRVAYNIAKWVPIGMANALEDYAKYVDKASVHLAEAATPNMREIDLSYATPDGIRSTLAGAVSGTVDVNARDDRLLGALASIERRLGDLEVVMDGEQVGRIVRPHVNAGNALDANVRRYF